MVRVCDGRSCQRAIPNKVYMLRTFGGFRARDLGRHRSGQAEPAGPHRHAASRIPTRTGGSATPASPISSPACRAGASSRMTQIYDLSDPHSPCLSATSACPASSPAQPAPSRRTPRPDLHRPEGQPHLFRLRHQQGRHAADRRSRETPQRPERTDTREPALPRDRPARHVGLERAHTTFPMLRMNRWRSLPRTRWRGPRFRRDR